MKLFDISILIQNYVKTFFKTEKRIKYREIFDRNSCSVILPKKSH